MEKTLCNYCHSKKFETFISNIKSHEFNERFTLVKCKECGLIYLNPRPVRKNIGKYYATKNYFSGTSDAYQEYSHIYDLIFQRLKKGKVFDIGAGTGLFLAELKKRGWKIDGLELSSTARKDAKKRFGVILKSGDFLNLKKVDKDFDLVVLNNVIEHLYKPRETVEKIAKIVKKDGYVLISCPNINSIGAVIFGRKWYAMDAPRHVYQFSPDSLKMILESSGFKVIKISHSFFRHNYMTLFESFRRTLSPRFSETKKTNKASIKIRENNKENKQAFIKKCGITVSKTLSAIIAVIEPLIRRGEIITLVAYKL